MTTLSRLVQAFDHLFYRRSDLLVPEVWDAETGRLRMSLRGCDKEITDLAVNQENTLLAAG